MPKRMITSEIFRNEKFGNLDDAGRIFFIGCFTNADDDGRLKASPKYLKALIFPYDNDKTSDSVQQLREQCQRLGLIQIYSNDGCEYLYCVGWVEHQSIRQDRYHSSTLPPPPDNQMATNPQPNGNQPATNPQPNINKYNINKTSSTTNDTLKEDAKDEDNNNVYKIYESNIGMLTPKIADELADIEKTYPLEWFDEAVKQACLKNARNLKYINAILLRYQSEGFKSNTKEITKQGKSKYERVN